MASEDDLRVRLDRDRETTGTVYRAGGVGCDATLVLAHGAGAGQRNPFMVSFARALAGLGLTTVTFDFPYAHERRRLPDRRPVLEACYRAVLDEVMTKPEGAAPALFLGGKSMGGRIATHVAAADSALPIDGIVLLGYPLHPPGRPGERRDRHLADVARPMLFVQGSRDAFGTPSELQPVLDRLSPRPSLHVVEGGDHSFKEPGADAGRLQHTYADVQRVIVAWVRQVIAARSGPSSPDSGAHRPPG